LSYLFRAVGITRSTGNPNVCNRCFTHVKEGHLVEMTVMFADLSSFTELTHELGADRTHAVVDRFLKMATSALVQYDAFIDKYIGDAVMAIFNLPIRRPDHPARAVAGAEAIQAGMLLLSKECGMELQAAVAIASGWARVAHVGSVERKDYTAIGNAVNLASRLEEQARPGEIVVDRTVYEAVAMQYPGVPAEALSLKGFPSPVEAYRLHAGAGPVRAARPTERPGSRALSFGAVLFAILGAPCVAMTLLGPMAVVLGLGSLFAASSAFWILDASAVSLPLLGLATVGATANLYALWHTTRLRQEKPSERGLATLSFWERHRTSLVVAAAGLTFLFVALELYLHRLYHP
jgi:adenylate cyclase